MSENLTVQIGGYGRSVHEQAKVSMERALKQIHESAYRNHPEAWAERLKREEKEANKRKRQVERAQQETEERAERRQAKLEEQQQRQQKNKVISKKKLKKHRAWMKKPEEVAAEMATEVAAEVVERTEVVEKQEVVVVARARAWTDAELLKWLWDWKAKTGKWPAQQEINAASDTASYGTYRARFLLMDAARKLAIEKFGPIPETPEEEPQEPQLEPEDLEEKVQLELSLTVTGYEPIELSYTLIPKQ